MHSAGWIQLVDLSKGYQQSIIMPIMCQAQMLFGKLRDRLLMCYYNAHLLLQCINNTGT